MPRPQTPVNPRLSAAVLSLLRGEVPATNGSPHEIEACLRHYECGGYLLAHWTTSGRVGELAPEWSAALTRSHRKTMRDNLAALAEFRRLGRLLLEEKVEFVLLKGGAYIGDLYADPGARRLTDIDLLIRQADVGRAARRLARAGYQGEVTASFPGNRRFEMWLASEGACRFEFHWGLGTAWSSVDLEALWERSRSGLLEDIPCRRLDPRDAVPYHAAHLAEHYFGPSLKWVIDLREMLRHWRPEPRAVADECRAWRARTALSLALTHVQKLFPGEVSADWLQYLSTGGARRAVLALYRTDSPLDLFSPSHASIWRYPLRCLALDGVTDVLRLALRALSRESRWLHAFNSPRPPWKRLD